MSQIRGYEANTVAELFENIAPPSDHDLDAFVVGDTCDEPVCGNRPEYVLVPAFSSDPGWEFPAASVCGEHLPERAHPQP